MFKFPWIRKRPARDDERHPEPAAMSAASPDIPPRHADNPATATRLLLRDESGQGKDLEFDLAFLLHQVLAENGLPADRHEDALFMGNGLILQPGFLSLEGGDGRIRSSTTVQANHPDVFPDGLFEFQHASGTSPEDALLNGFRSWAWMDLVALDAALQEKPDNCMTMTMDVPDGRKRRVVLSPFTHYMAEPPESGTDAAEEVEKYCPCCLLTSALELLMPVIGREGPLGLRLFAAMLEGTPQADCRVNGDDVPDAAEALRAYASTWLPKGDMEFRKQYAIVHDVTVEPASTH